MFGYANPHQLAHHLRFLPRNSGATAVARPPPLGRVHAAAVDDAGPGEYATYIHTYIVMFNLSDLHARETAYAMQSARSFSRVFLYSYVCTYQRPSTSAEKSLVLAIVLHVVGYAWNSRGRPWLVKGRTQWWRGDKLLSVCM